MLEEEGSENKALGGQYSDFKLLWVFNQQADFDDFGEFGISRIEIFLFGNQLLDFAIFDKDTAGGVYSSAACQNTETAKSDLSCSRTLCAKNSS